MTIRGGTSPNISSFKPYYFQIFKPQAKPSLGLSIEFKLQAFDFKPQALYQTLENEVKSILKRIVVS